MSMGPLLKYLLSIGHYLSGIFARQQDATSTGGVCLGGRQFATRGDRIAMLFAAMHETGCGRYCCKSRKSNNAKNLAKVDLWTSLLLRRFSTPLRRSVIDFGWSDMVPTSPRARRISGSKNFRSPPRKDFCNNICQ